MNRTRFLRIALETGIDISFKDLEDKIDVCFDISDLAKFYENVMQDAVRLVEMQRCHPGVDNSEFFRGHDQAINDASHTLRAHGGLE